MGLFKAFSAALSGTMKDQWKEFFYCNAIPNDTLLVKAVKMTSNRGSNNGSDNVITDGSVIAVADGEAALVVCNGKVTSVFTDPGEHIFRSDRTVGIFTTDDNKSTTETLTSDIFRRFEFGGDIPVVFRVYYMNTKEIFGNTLSISSIPIRICDPNVGLDVDITVSISGQYSIKIVEPYIIYSKIIGNVEKSYHTSEIASQLSSEISALVMSSLYSLSSNGLRVSSVTALAPEIGQYVKDTINPGLRKNRGIEIFSFPISGITVPQHEMNMISTLQRDKVFTDPTMAAAHITGATADAMKLAANNHGPYTNR